MTTEDAKSLLLKKREKQVLSAESAVSTGSTLLNLALTDDPDLGYAKGGYYYTVGDSASGKTWLLFSTFAEACRNPAFDKYEIYFDNVENGAMMDIARYFGKDCAKRVRSPGLKNGKAVNSRYIEDFYSTLFRLLDKGDPFLYALDSQDALDSLYAEKKVSEAHKAHVDDKESKGSYGDGKAKYHSENLRVAIGGIRETKSILTINGQTRDNLGMGFDTKTRSGGKALTFYANTEVWTSVHEKIKRNVRGTERTVGGNIFASVKKNRFTGKVGKDRGVKIPIYYGHGIDDVGSMVDYLIEEQQWKKAIKDGKEMKSSYDASELLLQGNKEQLIAAIEEDGLEGKLKKLTAQVWDEIEQESQVIRKPRYQ